MKPMLIALLLLTVMALGCAMTPPVPPLDTESQVQAIKAKVQQESEARRKKMDAEFAAQEQEYLAYEQKYWPGLRDNFPPLAKKLNYVCDRVTRFRPWESTERGMVYRVDCEGGLSYRMLKTPDDHLIITPWSYR